MEKSSSVIGTYDFTTDPTQILGWSERIATSRSGVTTRDVFERGVGGRLERRATLEGDGAEISTAKYEYGDDGALKKIRVSSRGEAINEIVVERRADYVLSTSYGIDGAPPVDEVRTYLDTSGRIVRNEQRFLAGKTPPTTHTLRWSDDDRLLEVVERVGDEEVGRYVLHYGVGGQLRRVELLRDGALAYVLRVFWDAEGRAVRQLKIRDGEVISRARYVYGGS